jgi:hypothetical protein
LIESTGSNATTFNTIANKMGTKGLRLDVHWGFMQRQVPLHLWKIIFTIYLLP